MSQCKTGKERERERERTLPGRGSWFKTTIKVSCKFFKIVDDNYDLEKLFLRPLVEGSSRSKTDLH